MVDVVLGLSGGVDSAVAARRLMARGFAVHGVFLKHGELSDEAARTAATELGISFEVVDISDELERNVMSEFERAYREGKTPNPCIVCNPTTKFPALLRVADRIGAEYIATGHYARVMDGKLYKNASANDQSYMLCRVPREILKRCLFPLGEVAKTDTRTEAAGLSAAAAPDSMEICFIPDGDYAAWLDKRGMTSQVGEFVDTHGNVLGTHGGTHRYTVGQRRGLGVAVGERLFVKSIDTTTNSIILAQEADMYANTVYITDVLNHEEIDFFAGFECGVKLRHSRKIDRAVAKSISEKEFELRFSNPVRIPAPGQFAALYHGDLLVASGLISKEPESELPPEE